jgi:hypothetical protein
MPLRPHLLCRVLGAVLALASASFTLGALWRLAAAEDVAPTKMDPTKVMGPKTCIECHKPEVLAWNESAHFKKFEDLGKNPAAKKYAAALGITEGNITREGLCVDCHGQRAHRPLVKEITAVSCESCHGPSGDENTGWLNRHASYGAKGLTRNQETAEHKQQRHADIDKVGMIRPARMYALAKNCLRCHAVPNEELVNTAKHHAGSADFELVSWVSGDVAHNLFRDPTKKQVDAPAVANAEAPTLWMAETGGTPEKRKRLLFVLGKLADLEVSLRNLAAAKAEGEYSQAMAGRARKAGGDLSDIMPIVPELEPAVTAFGKIRLLKLKPGSKEVLDVADTVAKTAQTVEEKHDGSKLRDLDAVLPKKGKNNRFEPGK